jgi:hypothetical protein
MEVYAHAASRPAPATAVHPSPVVIPWSAASITAFDAHVCDAAGEHELDARED